MVLSHCDLIRFQERNTTWSFFSSRFQDLNDDVGKWSFRKKEQVSRKSHILQISNQLLFLLRRTEKIANDFLCLCCTRIKVVQGMSNFCSVLPRCKRHQLSQRRNKTCSCCSIEIDRDCACSLDNLILLIS